MSYTFENEPEYQHDVTQNIILRVEKKITGVHPEV